MLFAADDGDDDHDDVVDKLILTSNTPWKERASRSITDRRAECFKKNLFFSSRCGETFCFIGKEYYGKDILFCSGKI